MATIRVGRRRRYTTIERAALNDERLSFRARGVLAWLLDKPDDWRVDSSAIARHGTEGREAIRTALRELEAIGYLVRTKHRGERGRFYTEVVVHECPPEQGAEDVTGAQESDAGGPGAGAPGDGAPGVLPLGLRPITETHTAAAPAGACSDAFDEFWSAVPSARRVGKGDARKAWTTATRKADPATIVAGMVRYAEETANTEPRYVATPGPWLRAERWSDEPGANRRSTGRGGRPVDEDRERPGGVMDAGSL